MPMLAAALAAREQRAIIAAYTQQSAVMRRVLLQVLLTMFRSMGSWRDADQAPFIAAAVPRVLGAQRQMAAFTDAYLTAMVGDMLGRPARPAGTPAPTVARLRGVDPDVVYARPFKTLYSSLGEGRSFRDSMDDAERRLASLASTDLQLAKTHTSRDVLEGEDRVRYYQRVLKGSKSCGLCIVASTQRYHKGDLLPIHPGCDCGVSPIVGDQDPGQVINSSRLEDVHEAIETTFGVSDRGGRNPIDYRDVLIEHVHGEIGPVLGRRGDHFTGPGDIAGSDN